MQEDEGTKSKNSTSRTTSFFVSLFGAFVAIGLLGIDGGVSYFVSGRFGFWAGFFTFWVFPAAAAYSIILPIQLVQLIKRSTGVIRFRSIPYSSLPIKSKMYDPHGKFLGYHNLGTHPLYDFYSVKQHELHVTFRELIFKLHFDLCSAMLRIAYSDRPSQKALHCVREHEWADFAQRNP